MSDLIQAKKYLREQMRNALSKMSIEEKQRESEAMAHNIVEFIRSHSTIKTVASYAATEDELNLDRLPRLLPELRFCYPKCASKGIMDFYEVSDLSEMKSMKMGIREPDSSLHSLIKPNDIDLFLCPAYAYSEDGKRLGKGGGYYDRYLLQKHPESHMLGIVFSCQKLPIDKIPIEAHDLLIGSLL